MSLNFTVRRVRRHEVPGNWIFSLGMKIESRISLLCPQLCVFRHSDCEPRRFVFILLFKCTYLPAMCRWRHHSDFIRKKKLPGPFHWCCFDSQHFLMSFVWHRTFCETCCEFQKEDKTSWKYSVRWVFINKESSKSCVLKHIAPWITVKEHCWIHWGCRVRTSVHFHTASHRNCQLSGTMSSGDAFLKSD